MGFLFASEASVGGGGFTLHGVFRRCVDVGGFDGVGVRGSSLRGCRARFFSAEGVFRSSASFLGAVRHLPHDASALIGGFSCGWLWRHPWGNGTAGVAARKKEWNRR